MAAPTNTKKDRQKIKDQADAAALKAEEMAKAGGIPMDGLSPTGVPESTIGMSKNEKFFSQGRLLDKTQREGYKTFGDKATGEGINKLRALQGRPPISNTPKEFAENINKSVGFGGKSALLDQAGRDRALKGGIGAGLSYEEADAAVSKAYDFLKKKYGDKTTPTTPTTPSTLDGSGNEPRVPTSSPTAPLTPTLPPEVPVEKSPTMQFMSDVLSGGSPERGLVKSGSLFLKGMKDIRDTKAAAEAAAKAAGATGGATGDAAKVVGKAGDVGALMRETQAGNRAFNETWRNVSDEKYAKAKAIADAKAPRPVGPDPVKFQEYLEKWGKAYGDALDELQPVGDETYDAARAATDAAKEASRNAVPVGGSGVGARMRETQAAGGAGETVGAVDEAAGAADEAAAAAGKGKGAVSRLLEGAAKSSLGKTAAVAGSVAGKGLRVAGRAAGPALEIYDAGRYFTGDEEVKNQYAEDAATLGQRVFQPKSAVEFAGGVGDVLSPTKNVLGTAEAVSQLLKSQRGARESEAALKNAQNLFKAREDRRKELYPDEEFAKLPKEMQTKIRQSIRQEFRDAGAKF